MTGLPADDPRADPLDALLARLVRDVARLDAPERTREAGLARRLAAERADPAPDTVRWWCSFADPDRHLGVAVVAALGPVHAVRRAHELGINPGGEVLVVPVLAADVPAAYWDRLLDPADVAALNAYGAATAGPRPRSPDRGGRP